MISTQDSYLTSWQYLARNLPQQPLPSEPGDRGQGGRGQAHHDVREGHVAHQQVHTVTKIWAPDLRWLEVNNDF